MRMILLFLVFLFFQTGYPAPATPTPTSTPSEYPAPVPAPTMPPKGSPKTTATPAPYDVPINIIPGQPPTNVGVTDIQAAVTIPKAVSALVVVLGLLTFFVLKRGNK